jgi:hypothetical protein
LQEQAQAQAQAGTLTNELRAQGSIMLYQST